MDNSRARKSEIWGLRGRKRTFLVHNCLGHNFAGTGCFSHLFSDSLFHQLVIELLSSPGGDCCQSGDLLVRIRITISTYGPFLVQGWEKYRFFDDIFLRCSFMDDGIDVKLARWHF
jgi:hypothetical protein